MTFHKTITLLLKLEVGGVLAGLIADVLAKGVHEGHFLKEAGQNHYHQEEHNLQVNSVPGLLTQVFKKLLDVQKDC